MKSILYTILLFTYSLTEAKTYTSIQSGKWNSTSTWDISGSPSENDTVVIHQSDTVFMNSPNGSCSALHVNGALLFNSSYNKLNCNVIHTFQNAVISGKSPGHLTCQVFFNYNSLDIGTINLTSRKTENYGEIKFTNTAGVKKTDSLINFGTISITESEKITVESYFLNNGACPVSSGFIETGSSAAIEGISTFPPLYVKSNNQVTTLSNIHLSTLDMQEGAAIDCEQSDTIFISRVISPSGNLKNHRCVVYEGKNTSNILKTDYHTLIIRRTGTDTLEFKGGNTVHTLAVESGTIKLGSQKSTNIFIHENALLLIGGANFVNQEFCSIKGELKILKNNYSPSFHSMLISKTGRFNNNTTADFTFSGSITNHGEFIGCKSTNCDYTFTTDTAFISGTKKINLPKVESKVIINTGKLEIAKSIRCLKLKNINYLALGADSNNIVGEFDFSTKGNTVCYNSSTEQHLNKKLNTFQNLTLSGGGKTRIHNNITVNENLIIEKESIFETDSFQIIGNSAGKIQLDSAAILEIGHNLSPKPSRFPLNFKGVNCLLHDSSTVKYQAKFSQEICTHLQYGNLKIDDGAVDSSFATLQSDSLYVKGNLSLEESSNYLVLKNKHVTVLGNWNGPGNIKAHLGTFELKGDGNGYGKINPGSSTFLYSGSRIQNLKPGDYNHLIINSSSTVKTKANIGRLKADKVIVQRGRLDFNTEEVDIQQLEVFDSISFSSSYQDKNFKHIKIHNNGTFLLNYPEQINISGNIENQGEFNCSAGKINFTHPTENQCITGNGKYIIHQMENNKKETVLFIKSDINLQDTLTIQSGNIILEQSQLYLSDNALITGENNSNQILGDEQASITIRKKESKSPTDSLGNFGFHLHQAGHLSNIELTRKFEIIHEINGLPSCKRIFEINWENDSLKPVYFKTHMLQQELNNFNPEDIGVWAINNSTKTQTLLTQSEQMSYTAPSLAEDWKIVFAPENLVTLPVHLLSFEADRMNNEISSKWEVVEELKTNRYILAQSRNLQIDSIASIKAEGLSQYHFKFDDPINTASELLLFENSIQTDNLIASTQVAGSENKRKVWIENQEIQIFPPFKGEVKIIDINGKQLNETNSNFKNGVFIIQLIENNTVTNYKIKN